MVHHLSPNDGGAHWVRSPMTTRHSQTSILLVSLTWGLSYCMPPSLRVSFSEVFPPSLERWSSIPMWGWGIAMLFAAVSALIGEQLILKAVVGRREPSRFGWRLSIFAHTCLAAIYFTLTIAALVSGIREAHWQAAAIISAISRPVLWGYIAYLHVTYSKLPSPYAPRVKKPRGKLKLFSREPVITDGSD